MSKESPPVKAVAETVTTTFAPGLPCMESGTLMTVPGVMSEMEPFTGELGTAPPLSEDETQLTGVDDPEPPTGSTGSNFTHATSPLPESAAALERCTVTTPGVVTS